MNFGWLFTNVLALGGMCYGWLNPLFALMVFYSFSILRPTSLWFWVSWPTRRYSFYVGIATLIGWGMAGFGDWSGLRAVRMPLMGLVVYLLCGVLTWQIGINSTRAGQFLYPQVTIGIMAIVTMTLVREERSIRIFTWVILAALAYLAWVFNSQYVFDGWNRVYFNGFGGIDNNGVAMMMVVGVPIAFFVGVYDKRLWVKGVCFFSAISLIHVVLLTFSRGGQLGLLIIGLGIFVTALTQLPKKGITIALAVLFVAATIYLAGSQVRDEFWSIFADKKERDASAASRFDTWGAAWRCMLNNPIGLGPRNFNLVSDRYGLAPGKSVHNLFLQTGADYGFAGMIGLIMFYFGAVFKTYLMTRTEAAKRLGWPRYTGHMVCLSLGGFLVCSVFIGMETVEVGFLIALLGLCTVAYVDRNGSSAVADPPTEQAPRVSDFEDEVVDEFGDVTAT